MSETSGRMQLGLLLRAGEMRQEEGRRIGWTELNDIVRVSEDVGFDTLWMPDHVLYRNAGSVVLPEGKTVGAWEAFTILAAMAAVTKRVTIGPFVACNSFRSPALLAKMADTLDEVSNGRVLLGLGAGWHQPEYDAFGYPFDHLAGRFDEALQIIAPLLRTGHVDFHGQYYQAADCELRPRGPRGGGIPIWIGAKGPRMLRLVARYADAYNAVWYGEPNELVEPFARLDEACRDVGRDPATIQRTTGVFAVSPGSPGDTAAPANALRGSADEIAAKLLAFRSVGVSHITLILDPWNVESVERFGPVIEAMRRSAG